MTAAELEAWLLRAQPGQQCRYHVGHLAYDRTRSRAVDATARYALEHSRGEWPVVTPPPCGHIRSLLIGSGELALKQHRGPDGRMIYVAEKL
jgi:hypothetical protein